jgi:hypothetical protein
MGGGGVIFKVHVGIDHTFLGCKILNLYTEKRRIYTNARI